jgi:hypothetical protein
MGWTLFFMLVILKIPLAAALWLIWYAVKEEPEPEEQPGSDEREPWRKPPPLPRSPRRRRLPAGSLPAAGGAATPTAGAGLRPARLSSYSARFAGRLTPVRLPHGRLSSGVYWITARASRWSPTLRFTRWSALSTVFVSQASQPPISS